MRALNRNVKTSFHVSAKRARRALSLVTGLWPKVKICQWQILDGIKAYRLGMGAPGDILPSAKILVRPYGLKSNYRWISVGVHQDRRKPCRPVNPSPATREGISFNASVSWHPSARDQRLETRDKKMLRGCGLLTFSSYFPNNFCTGLGYNKVKDKEGPS